METHKESRAHLAARHINRVGTIPTNLLTGVIILQKQFVNYIDINFAEDRSQLIAHKHSGEK